MHAAAFTWVAEAAAEFGPVRSVVEFGSRDINGSVRSLFSPPARYIGVDVAPGDGVDVVADGASWTPEYPVSVVVCCEVFEHTADWRSLCESAARALAAGGVFICTAAGPGRDAHSAGDGGPLRPDEFYGNVSPEELEAELGMWFSDVRVDCTGPDVRAVAVKGGM